MKKVLKWHWILWIIPFVLGVYGYSLIYGNNLPGAAYSALRLYGLDIDVPEEQLNIYIQIARWLAIASVVSAVTMILKNLISRLRLQHKLRDPEVIVVHGDEGCREKILTVMAPRAIPASSDICFRAKQHVLAFDTDAAALAYLKEKENHLLVGKGTEEKKVYFLSRDFEPSDYATSGLIISNNAVNCARLYWQKNWLRDESVSKIGIIGFGAYGRRMLEQALLVNVLIREKPIEYHIFGSDGRDFLDWRRELRNAVDIGEENTGRDRLIFHPEGKPDTVKILEGMHRIIITTDSEEENLLWLNRMLDFCVNSVLHVRCNREIQQRLNVIPEKKRETLQVMYYGDDAVLYNTDVVMHGALCRKAVETHIQYVENSRPEKISKKYASCSKKCTSREETCAGCKWAICTWDDLPPFDKASNIAAADHEPVKEKLLEDLLPSPREIPKSAEAVEELLKSEECPSTQEKSSNVEIIKKLLRVEHDRWARFYYLHNGKYGAVRDDAKRIHPCLVPFDSLKPEIQAQDWYTYDSLIQKNKNQFSAH